MTSSLESLTKIGLYSALLVLLGANAARWLLRTGAFERATVGELDRRMARFGVAAGWLLVGLLFGRLLAHSLATFGSQDGLSWDNLSLIAWRSRWGARWRLQVFVAVMALVAARWARTPATLFTATAAAVAAAATFSLTGHASGDALKMVIDSAHLVAVALWLGTLAVLVRVQPPPALFARFSPLAFIAVTVAVMTGLSMTALYLGTLSSLWTTTYGRILLAKLTLVGLTAGCGFVNWRSLQRGGAPPAAMLETLLGLGVVVVTAVLTETEHP